jgi:hypothetical protein
MRRVKKAKLEINIQPTRRYRMQHIVLGVVHSHQSYHRIVPVVDDRGIGRQVGSPRHCTSASPVTVGHQGPGFKLQSIHAVPTSEGRKEDRGRILSIQDKDTGLVIEILAGVDERGITLLL